MAAANGCANRPGNRSVRCPARQGVCFHLINIALDKDRNIRKNENEPVVRFKYPVVAGQPLR